MSRPGLMPFMGLLMAMLLITGMPVAGLALPTWPLQRGSNQDTSLSSQSPSGRLQEVAPPGAVQQLREKLQRYQPNLRLVSPTDDSVINADSVDLVLDVRDWPVSRDIELGLGPHVVVQIDNQPPRQLDELDGNRVRLRIDGLSAGSHRFSAWAAYPWGEAIKTPGANLQGRFHLWQRVEGTQPEDDAPWLVPVTSSASPALQPLLLDWIIWNAPLQNLRDGDGRWRLRLSVDGDSFLVDQQEALWLKGSPSSSGNLVQMELLNGVGEPITPEFNNQLIHQSGRKTPPPTWLKARLTEDELARLSGTPLIPAEELVPEAKATPEPIEERETKPEAQPVVTAESLTASPDDDEATASPKPEASAEAEKVEESGNGVSDLMESEPEPKLNADALGDEQDSTDDSDDSTFEQAADDVSKDNSDDLAPPAEPIALDDQAPLPKSEKPSMPVPSASEERLIPTSRLGGSARELLNDDGSLRKP
ncbi:MAG: hypothetical protein ACJ0GX_04655 [Parasynechococcus sp.]|uniref:hypothetical protein n=1 Tax=Parasynechococcus sp. TaxID=3101203 RepID=UPI003885E7D7